MNRLFSLTLAVSLWAIPATTQQHRAGGISLDDAVRLALDHHPMVRSAEQGVDLARATVAEAGAARLPTVLAEASVTRFQEPMIVAPLHAFDITALPAFDPTLIQGRVFANMTLFDGGIAGARRRAASAGVDAASASVENARMSTIVQVTASYLEVLAAMEVDSAHAMREAALLSERNRVSRLLIEGRVADVDLLQVDAAIARAQAERAAALASRDGAMQHLLRLTGLDSTRLSFEDLRRPTLSNPSQENATYTSSEHPDVKRAVAQFEAAEYQQRAVTGSRFPSIQLRGGYVTYAAASGEFTAEWQAGLQVSFPLFTGGARSAAIDKTQAQYEMASQQVELARWQTEQSADQARVMATESSARRDALAAAVLHLSEAVRIMRVALQEGVGLQSEYLRAEAELATVRSDLTRATYAIIRARLQQAFAAGELTLEWLTTNLEIAR